MEFTFINTGCNRSEKASRALHKLVSEMEKTLRIVANTGQRNISGYNAMIQRQIMIIILKNL